MEQSKTYRILCTQIRFILQINAVWSVFTAGLHEGVFATHRAHSEDFDQTAGMCRLTLGFAGYISFWRFYCAQAHVRNKFNFSDIHPKYKHNVSDAK